MNKNLRGKDFVGEVYFDLKTTAKQLRVILNAAKRNEESRAMLLRIAMNTTTSSEILRFAQNDMFFI